MPVSPDHLPDHLREQFLSLPEPHQDFLCLLSLIYTPVSSKTIAEILKQINQTTSLATINKYLFLLREHGLLSKTNQCHPDLTEILARQAMATNLYPHLAKQLQIISPRHTDSTKATFIRDMRLALYSQDFDTFNHVFLSYYDQPPSHDISPLTRILNNPFSPQISRSLPLHLRLHSLRHIINDSLVQLSPLPQIMAFLRDETNFQEFPEAAAPITFWLQGLGHLQHIDLKEIINFKQQSPSDLTSMGITAFLAFRQGENDLALTLFKQDLQLLQQEHGKSFYFTGQEGIIFLLALLKTRDFRHLDTILDLCSLIKKGQPDSPYFFSYQAIEQFCRFRQSSFSSALSLPNFHQDNNPFTFLISSLCTLWTHHSLSAKRLTKLKNYHQLATKHGFSWLAAELLFLIQSGANNDQQSLPGLAGIIPKEQSWQRALQALTAFKESDLAEKSGPKQRLIWLLELQSSGLTITPRLQKKGTNQNWSKGRAISLARLYQQRQASYLCDEDQGILAAMQEKKGYGSKSTYVFINKKLLPALIDHPNLFLAQEPQVAVQVSKGEAELRISQFDDQLHLQLRPMPGHDHLAILPQGFNHLKVITITDEHRRIASIIGNTGLFFPCTAHEQLQETIDNLATKMPVFSEIGQDNTALLQEANAKIIIHLTPSGNGFRLIMLVRPFGKEGPIMQPGLGARQIIATINDKRLQVCRDLKREQQNCRWIIDHCQTLRHLEHEDYQWRLAKAETCLTTLEELERIKGMVQVEWPSGARLAIASRANLHNLKMTTQQKGNWFSIDGELTFDQDKVMELRQLLNLAQNQQNRFIPLADGQFLALSKSLQRQISSLATLTQQQNNIQLSPFAAPFLANLSTEGVQIAGDNQWRQLLQKINEAQHLIPPVPKDLTGILRSYQKAGFSWLARLAHWGGGACLADDMGLGKTMQSLALLLHQAKKGPSLVVTPTSVCGNWWHETITYAPSLTPYIFGAGDRQQALEDLQPNDLMITSYALLQQEAKLFAQQKWQVIILDEAQAIKNRATKRSSAAMALQGECKVITTGTPIENHLGELWNLFQFINPGLLGTLNNFNRNFAIPIERHQDDKARQRLKAILAPFILRRLKTEVVQELPPRTEIILKVEMSTEEHNMYEALRQEAVERINREPSNGQQTMQILAEITKLRLASCHPRLVYPQSALPSSKLSLFGKVITEILENKHNALIFSQFVRHLDLIRQFLDSQGISYQYLDGSTPVAKRGQIVADFQNGKGDVFLISLKAGGTGLNLTRADYVIHMDPWWNPAVENQASDRAHRIGQTRPVTIYRLVTANTIEEKIVELHQAKKELADSLLAGHSTENRLDAKKLLALLKNDR